MNENQITSLLKRLNLRIMDRNHLTLRDYPMRDDLILLQTHIADQQKEIDRLRKTIPAPADPPLAA